MNIKNLKYTAVALLLGMSIGSFDDCLGAR